MTIMSKQKRNSFTIFLAFVLILTLSLSTTVLAKNDEITSRSSQHRLENGISHVNYYITDSVLNYSTGSNLVYLIDQAANSWVDTGYGWNPLYMYRSYDFYNSNMDFYLTQGYAEGFTMGNITYWKGNSANPIQVYPHQSDWVYSEITLFIKMFEQSGNQKMQRVIAHFIGLGLGLSSNNDPNSVMCSFYTTCNVYKPGIMDHNALNALYGN